MIKLPAWVAPSFKKPRGITGFITDWYMRKYNFFVYPAIDKEAQIADGMRILEIGFGPGMGLQYFFSKYNVNIDGVDFSRMMCRAAAKRNKKHLASGALSISCDDFLSRDFGIMCYDRIVFANVIYFWDDIKAAFEKIRSLLNNGGRAVFYMSSPSLLQMSKISDNAHFIHHPLEDVLHALKESGFAMVKSARIKDDSGYFNIIRADV